MSRQLTTGRHRRSSQTDFVLDRTSILAILGGMNVLVEALRIQRVAFALRCAGLFVYTTGGILLFLVDWRVLAGVLLYSWGATLMRGGVS